jgi:predicted small lipoprotein YifL
MQSVKTSLVILVYVALISACGLRGPLYLPDENPTTKPDVEQGSAADTDEEKNKDDEEKDKKKEIVSG